MPDPFIKKQAKENKQAKAAESFRAKEAQSLTKSIGTIDTISKPTVKPLVQPREKDDEVKTTSYEPYTNKDVYKLPSNVVKISSLERRPVIPKGPDYSEEKFKKTLPKNPYQSYDPFYIPNKFKGMSYGEILADNVIGLDNGYDTVVEKLAQEFNKDEIKFLKNMAIGVYEGTLEFIADPLGSISSYVSGVSEAGKNLWTLSLEKRLELMFDITNPYEATEAQMNQAREAVLGDILRVAEAAAITKVATTAVKFGASKAKPPMVKMAKNIAENYVDKDIGLGSSTYKKLPAFSAIEEFEINIPENFKNIRETLAKPIQTTSSLSKPAMVLNNLEDSISEDNMSDILARTKEKIKGMINVDDIKLVNNQPKFEKNMTLFSFNPISNQTISETSSDPFGIALKTQYESLELDTQTVSVDLDKANPLLFEYSTPSLVANFNNNPINKGLPEDFDFVQKNSYLTGGDFGIDPTTFYNGKPYGQGKGTQTFSPLVRLLNNYPDYNQLKRKKIISPRNLWKHLSANKFGKKQSLAFVFGGEDRFASQAYEYFWEKGFIPDNNEISDAGNNLLKADEYYSVIEKHLNNYNNSIKNPTAFTYLDRLTNKAVTFFQIQTGHKPFIFEDKNSFESFTQLSNNDFFNYVNKQLQLPNTQGSLPYNNVANFEVDIYTNADSKGATGKSTTSLIVERNQNYLDEQAIKEWNSKEWVTPNYNDSDFSNKNSQVIKNRQNYVIRMSTNQHALNRDANSARGILNYNTGSVVGDAEFFSPRFVTTQSQIGNKGGAGYLWSNEEIFDEDSLKLIKENKIPEQEVINKRIYELNEYVADLTFPVGGWIALRVPRDVRNQNFQNFMVDRLREPFPIISEQATAFSIEDLFFELKNLNMKFAQKDIDLSNKTNQPKVEFSGISDPVVFSQIVKASRIFENKADNNVFDGNDNLKFHVSDPLFTNRQRLGSNLTSPNSNAGDVLYAPTIRRYDLKFNSLIQFFTQATAPYVLSGVIFPKIKTKDGFTVENRKFRRLTPIHTTDTFTDKNLDKNTIGISGISVANPLTFKINSVYDNLINEVGYSKVAQIMQNNKNLHNLKAHRFVNIPFNRIDNHIEPPSQESILLINDFLSKLSLSVIDKNYGSQEKFPVTYSNTTPYANEIDGETLIENGVSRKFVYPENTGGIVPFLNQKNYAYYNEHEFDVAKLFVIKELDENLYNELLDEMVTESYNKNPRVSQVLEEPKDSLIYEIPDLIASQKFSDARRLHPFVKNADGQNLILQQFYTESTLNEVYEGFKLKDLNDYVVKKMNSDGLSSNEVVKKYFDSFDKLSSPQFVFSRDLSDRSNIRTNTMNQFNTPKYPKDLTNLELLRELTDTRRQKSAEPLKGKLDYSYGQDLDDIKKQVKELEEETLNFKNSRLLTDYVDELDKIYNKMLLENKQNKDNNNNPTFAGKTKSSFYKQIRNSSESIEQFTSSFHDAGAESLGHTRFIYSPNMKVALINELQFDALQQFKKAEMKDKEKSTLDIDKEDSFSFDQFRAETKAQKGFKRLVEDVFENSGLVKIYLNKYARNTSKGIKEDFKEYNIPELPADRRDSARTGVSTYFEKYNIFYDKLIPNNLHGDYFRNIGFKMSGKVEERPSRQYSLTSSVFDKDLNGYKTEITKKDNEPFQIQDLVYINDMQHFLNTLLRSREYNDKDLYRDLDIKSIEDEIKYNQKLFDTDSTKFLSMNQVFRLLMYEQFSSFKKDLKREIPIFDFNITVQQLPKPKKRTPYPQSIGMYVDKLLGTDRNLILDMDYVEDQIKKNPFKVFLSFVKPKSRQQQKKEVEEKIKKEVSTGYTPVADEVEVMEKLMLSLILEAKRNGAEKIVIPPYERILFARYAGASNPFPKIPEMEERYGKRLNEALNNIIQKSGGKVKGAVEFREYLPFKKKMARDDFFKDVNLDLSNTQMYKVRVLDIKELFKDMPKNKEINIKIGMSKGGLVA